MMTPHDILVRQFSWLSALPESPQCLRDLIHEAAVTGGLSGKGHNWAREPLGEVIPIIQTGPFGSLLHKSDYVAGGTPLINPINLKDGGIVPDKKKTVSKETLARLHLYLVRDGDVVLGRRGEMGKCAIVTAVEHGWLCGTGSAFLRPSARISSAFLIVWLRSPGVRKRLAGEAVGSTMQNLNQRILRSLQIPLPPLDEQRRIVAKVDELLALCDELEAKQKKKAQVSVQLNKAALHALVEAPDPKALRKSWKRIEDNFDLLYDRIENVEGLRQAIIDLLTRGAFGTCKDRREVGGGRLQIPADWQWLPLKELGRTQTGTTPSTKNTEYWGGDLPFVRPGDIEEPDIRAPDRALSRAGAEVGRLIPAGSVLMVCIGGSLGKVGHVTEPVSCNQQINAITPVEVNSRYLALALRATDFQKEVWAKAGQGTLPITSKSKWERIAVPVPPTWEQRIIVERADSLMALCDDLETKLEQADQHGERLMRAVVESLVA